MNVAMGLDYLKWLHADFKNDEYIFWNKQHSLEHFSIVWMMILFAITMFLEVAFTWIRPMQFLIYLSYNMASVFVVYPHLISEK